MPPGGCQSVGKAQAGAGGQRCDGVQSRMVSGAASSRRQAAFAAGRCSKPRTTQKSSSVDIETKPWSPHRGIQAPRSPHRRPASGAARRRHPCRPTLFETSPNIDVPASCAPRGRRAATRTRRTARSLHLNRAPSRPCRRRGRRRPRTASPRRTPCSKPRWRMQGRPSTTRPRNATN